MPAAFRVTLIALGLSAYVAACMLAPVPAPAPTPAPVVTPPQPTEVEVQNDEAIAGAVAAQSLPTAVGWLGSDTIWTNDDHPYPIASLTKLVTALVGLEQAPLDPGEAGAVHVWDERDLEHQSELLALDGVVFPIPLGTEVTHHEMLILMLVPSANDFAISYAYSIFGDNETFVRAVDAWKDRHGLESLQVDEPSGISSDNVAHAADLVRISQLALANPVVAEIVASESVDLPWGIGVVVNTNPLFGLMPGVVGVKTGFTEAAGYNLAAAVRAESDGHTDTAIAVVLGRDSVDSYAEDAHSLLTTLIASPHTAGTPFPSIDVPIHIENGPQPPGSWWRITHPLALFGIGEGRPVT